MLAFKKFKYKYKVLVKKNNKQEIQSNSLKYEKQSKNLFKNLI